MIITKKHLPRRTFLRGLAGTAVALPLLDSMIPALTAQTKTAAKPQFRAAFIYTPHGVILDQWVPKTTGTDYEMTPILKPIESFRNRFIIVSNLAENKAKQAGSGHASSSATWLSAGVTKDTQGEDVQAGTTIDQMIARKIGQDTPIPSLELGIEDVSNMIGICDATSSCAYLNTMSWSTPTTPLPAEINPKVVFERMFGDGSSAAKRFERLQDDRSLLDDITGSAKDLQKNLSAQDKTRITDYLDNLETYEDHVGLMFDLQVVAFQADITRVSTFMMSRELNNRTYPYIGVPEQHHSISHHQYDPLKMAQHQKINTYHVQLYSKFLTKMQETKDGDGSLLDHSMVLYGSGMGDGNVHSHDPISVLLGGGAIGQIKGGRHIQNPKGTSMGNLLLPMLEMAGIQQDKIGDSTGKISLS